MQKHPIPCKKIVFVCTGPNCSERGSEALLDRLKDMAWDREIAMDVRVARSGCTSGCDQGPNILVLPDNTWYSHVTAADLEPLLDSITAGLGAE